MASRCMDPGRILSMYLLFITIDSSINSVGVIKGCMCMHTMHMYIYMCSGALYKDTPEMRI